MAASASEKKKEHKSVQIKGSLKQSNLGMDNITLDLANKGDWQAVADRLETLNTGRTTISKGDTWLAFAYMYIPRCDRLKALEQKFNITEGTKHATPFTVSYSSPAEQIGILLGANRTLISDAVAPVSVTDAKATSASSSNSKSAPADASTFATSAESANALIIKAYSQMCQQKLADADKTLAPLKGAFPDDPEVNFALAAIAGKIGRFTEAANYTQRTIELAPNFAWGFRTLGMIEHRFLKDDVAADQAFAHALQIEPTAKEVTEALVDIRLAKNNFDGAIDVCNDALRVQPKDASNYFRLAQIYIQQWRLREALEQLQTAIKLDPQDSRFYRSRASIKRYQGDLAEAIDDEKNAVEYAKDKAFELGELAAMNLLAGHKSEAIESLQASFKIDAKNKQIRDRLVALLTDEHRYDDLIALYRQLLESDAKDGSLHLGLAKALVRSGKTDEAVKEFIESANLNPSDPEPHRELGALRIIQRDFSAAAKEYTRALNINPSSVQDLVSLGFCYAQDDEFMSAEAAFVTSLALQQLTQQIGVTQGPTHLQINRSLAGLLFEEGRYSDAAAQLEAIYAMSKNTPEGQMDNLMLAQAKSLRDLTNAAAQELVDAYNALPDQQRPHIKSAVVETLLNAGKLDLALKTATATPDIEPLAVLDLAKAYRLKNELAKAEESVSNMVAVKGLNSEQQSEIYEEMSQIAFAKTDLVKSEEMAKKALGEYSKNYAAYETLGRIALKKSDYKGAIDSANKSIAINPYFTRAYLLLGDAQRESADMKNAAINYRKAAELYPGLLEAHRSLLQVLQKLALKDEARREEEQIATMERQQLEKQQ